MQSVLIVVDAAAQAEAAARYVAAEARDPGGCRVHLLNVQAPLGAYIARFLDRETVRRFRSEEAQRAFAPAQRILGQAGLPFETLARVGDEAAVVARTAAAVRAEEIVMGPDGPGLVTRTLFQWLVGRVVRRTDVPVTIVQPPRTAAGSRHALDHWRAALSR